MRFITDIAELEGKTIKKAVAVDIDESIALSFTDGTYAFFDVRFYGDSHDIFLSANVEDYQMREGGIISDAEYEKRQKDRDAKRAAHMKHVELEELARLKEKYGN